MKNKFKSDWELKGLTSGFDMQSEPEASWKDGIKIYTS